MELNIPDMTFGKHFLSDKTKEKLRSIKNSDGVNLESLNSSWKILFQSEAEDKIENKMQNIDDEDAMIVDNDQCNQPEPSGSDDLEIPSSQFFFTQTKPKEPLKASKKQVERSLDDVVDSLFVVLELSTGSLEPEDMNSLTDTDAVQIIDKLSVRLSSKGIYNLCCSICNMDVSLGTYYAKIICSKLLLPLIIEIENSPSRMELSALLKITETFPEDVRKCLLIPLFKENVKSHKVIQTLIKHYGGDLKKETARDFVEIVRELRQWHVAILPSLIDVNIENDVKTEILSLLVEQALNFAEDKLYSQCILSFIKTQSPFTDEQKNMLHEIVTVHKTIFKRPMMNMLEQMFIHRDMWHVS